MNETAKKIFDTYANRKGCWWQMITIIVFVLLFVSACKTKTKIEYVDKEVVRYEYKTLYDTLIQNNHDSVFQTIYQKGDTVYNIKYKEKIQWRDKIVNMTDTLYRDSIQNVVVKETVEKKIIPKWCYYSLLFSILCLIFAIYKLVKWLRSLV